MESDHDFDAMRSDLQDLHDQLRDQAKAEAESILDSPKILDAYYIEPCLETQPLIAQLNETAARFNRATTYLDYCALIPKLKICREMLDKFTGYREIAFLGGHRAWIRSVCFSPDGKFLASGSEDKTVRLWDVGAKTQIAQLEGHTDWVPTVNFSPSGKLLVSGSGDGTLGLWGINLVITKAEQAEAERAEQERLQREAERKRQAEAEEEHRRCEAQEAITDARQSLEGVIASIAQELSVDAEKYASHELQSTRELLNEAQATFEAGNFEKVKPLANRARSAAVRAKAAARKRFTDERRRNGQCIVCGTKLGFFEKCSGNDKCKAHR